MQSDALLAQSVAAFDRADLPGVVTFAGTGINGAAHVEIVERIGHERLRIAKEFNVVSGSCYSYFISLAKQTSQLQMAYFTDFDRINRRLHSASFFRALKFALSPSARQRPLYDNALLDLITTHLFDASFCSRKLAELPKNVAFWAYCMNRKTLVAFRPGNEFGEMTLAEVLRACVSIGPLHGRFEWRDFAFTDPVYSPAFGDLRRRLCPPDRVHVYVNMHVNRSRGNSYYVTPWHLKTGNMAILRDFALFGLNLPNPTIGRTHRRVLEQVMPLPVAALEPLRRVDVDRMDGAPSATAMVG